MEVFFYGLFMDQDLLAKNGIKPSNTRKGCLNEYTLKIGNQASLVPSKNERSYGLVMTIDEDAVRALYAQESVADYIPEEVTIITDTNETVKATCYNLPPELLSGKNESYAQALHKLGTRLGFPTGYLDKIKS